MKGDPHYQLGNLPCQQQGGKGGQVLIETGQTAAMYLFQILNVFVSNLKQQQGGGRGQVLIENGNTAALSIFGLQLVFITFEILAAERLPINEI